MRFFSKFRGALALGLAGVLAANCGSDDGAKKDRGDAGAAGEAESNAGQPSTSGGSRNQAGEGAGGSSAGLGGEVAGGTEAGGMPSSDAGAPGQGGVMESAGAGGGGEPIEVLSCQDANPGQPTTAPTTVNFVNNTPVNIYLGSPTGDCAFGFQLFDGASELLPARGVCDQTCGELQEDGCDCEYQCVPIVTMIAPGGKYDIGWPGTVFTSHFMADACFSDPSCAGQACFIESAAPAGPLTIRAAAYPDKECDAGECLDCTPGGFNKNCTVFGAQRTTGVPLTGEVAWSGGGTVTVNFGQPPE